MKIVSGVDLFNSQSRFSFVLARRSNSRETPPTKTSTRHSIESKTHSNFTMNDSTLSTSGSNKIQFNTQAIEQTIIEGIHLQLSPNNDNNENNENNENNNRNVQKLPKIKFSSEALELSAELIQIFATEAIHRSVRDAKIKKTLADQRLSSSSLSSLSSSSSSSIFRQRNLINHGGNDGNDDDRALYDFDDIGLDNPNKTKKRKQNLGIDLYDFDEDDDGGGSGGSDQTRRSVPSIHARNSVIRTTTTMTTTTTTAMVHRNDNTQQQQQEEEERQRQRQQMEEEVERERRRQVEDKLNVTHENLETIAAQLFFDFK